jgi:hypothetical protein
MKMQTCRSVRSDMRFALVSAADGSAQNRGLITEIIDRTVPDGGGPAEGIAVVQNQGLGSEWTN